MAIFSTVLKSSKNDEVEEMNLAIDKKNSTEKILKFNLGHTNQRVVLGSLKNRLPVDTAPDVK